MKVERFFPEDTFGQCEVLRCDAFAAAADYMRTATAKFDDFIHHVRFERGWELIDDVSDGSHAADSSETPSVEAQSIPATVNISTMTNW